MPGCLILSVCRRVSPPLIVARARRVHSGIGVRRATKGSGLDGLDHRHGVFCFGSFRLDPVSRVLLQGDVRVHLPARLFDTLLYLVEHHDRLVEREELSRAVWSTHAVSAGNLGRAISSLRIALKSVGEDSLIVTAPGRGYRFGVPVRWEPAGQPLQASAAEPAPASAKPRRRGWALAAGLLLAAMGLAAVGLWPRAGTAFAPPPHSIAVLPFVNHGANAADTLYSDGIAQELINTLGRIPGMRVAASTSSFLFRNKNATIGDIARQLNVGAVLEGSVQRTGARIHITVELIDATNGFQLWSHVYDQDQGDVLTMQGQMAAAVVTSLKGVMLGDEAAQLTLGGTTNAAAFDAYLRGMAAEHPLDPVANRAAITHFNLAVQLDPTYALAFAQRARALTFIASYGNSPDVDYSHRVMQAAVEDAQRAVTLAPELGMAHAALGFALQATLTDLPRADAELHRAVALAPGDSVTLLAYGRFQLEMGHVQEGIDAAEQAAALDPLAAHTHGTLAIILGYARRYDAAKVALHRADVLLPNNEPFDRITFGLLDTMAGDAQAAERICAGDVDYRDMMCLAIADHMLGHQPAAEAELAKARAVLGDNGAFLYARIYAQWGQPDAALRWLQTAYEVRDPGLIELKIDPALDPVRATTQYQALVRRLGFPA